MAALGWLLNLDFAAGVSETRTGLDWYGTVTVGMAGTAVNFTTADIPIKRCYFRAPTANTGDVYLGGSDVSSTVMGRLLEPGESFEVDFTDDLDSVVGRWGNLNEFYLDAANANDVIMFLAVPVGR